MRGLSDPAKHKLGSTSQSFLALRRGVFPTDEAFGFSFLPSDGVGLARMEFIISNHIRVHPMALVDFDKLPDPA
ncbi:MAG: hypothetical protein Q8K78_18605, partial [Planctomycetaceae bacterium]|nr:hypothetical protein [Planctomycetaceae bacterium]